MKPMELKLPLDFERLPEFWLLAERLRDERMMAVTVASPQPSPAEAEREVMATAILLWVRLWVLLGYLARSTNRPGWLNESGARQLNAAFPQFGDETSPVTIMEGNLLRKAEDGGWQCDLFAGLNPHLAGNFVSGVKRGNLRSRLKAAQTEIAASAMQQGLLLPPEHLRKRDGTTMVRQEIDRAMILVMTLDRCLSLPRRKAGDFGEGLLADACAVAMAHDQKDLQQFYYWLAEHAGNAALPASAEEILKDWDRIWKTAVADRREP